MFYKICDVISEKVAYFGTHRTNMFSVEANERKIPYKYRMI